MKTQLPIWRVALGGLVTFLLFSIILWKSFLVFTSFLIENNAAQARLLPNPIVPSIFSAIITVLLASCGIALFRKSKRWHNPPDRLSTLADRRADGDLYARLLLLVVLLMVGTCVSHTFHLAASRCTLFTTQMVCAQSNNKFPQGSYHLSDGDGQTAGVYPESDHGLLKIGKFWLDKFSFEDVEVERTRFGWPIRAITRDVVSNHGLEWNVVFEVYVIPNLFLWFLAWLFIQPIIALFHNWCVPSD